MKKILYAVILVFIPSLPMQRSTNEYLEMLPKEIWVHICSFLVTTDKNSVKNYAEIKKLKLISKFFYAICDSDAIHTFISPDFVTSTLLLNTKQKRERFDKLFFTSDYKNLFWIFQRAAIYNIDPMIKRCIERGIDPNHWFGLYFKTTALCTAAKKNNIKAAQALLDHPLTNPNASDEFGETPLTLAAQENHGEILKLLLKHPIIDPEKRNNYNLTALTIALNNHQEMAANILILDQERRQRNERRSCACLCGPTSCAIS